jgi:lipopolysaccharide export system permease protein
MPVVFRCLIRHLLTHTGIVLGVLVSVLWLAQVARLLDRVVGNGYSLWVFLKCTLMALPLFLSVLLPLSLFIGIIQTYYHAQKNHHLTIWQTCGCSPLRLALPGLSMAVIFTLLSYTLTLYLSPHSTKRLHELKNHLSLNYLTALVRPGVFQDIDAHTKLFIGGVSGHHFQRIFLVHHVDNQQRIITAKQGQFLQHQDQLYFTLNQGSINTPDQTIAFNNYTLNLSYLQHTHNHTHKPAIQELSMHALNDPPKSLSAAEALGWHREKHKRLLSPLYCLALTMIGLAYLLTQPPQRLNRFPYGTVATGALIFGAGLFAQSLLSATYTPVIYGTLSLLTFGGLAKLYFKSRPHKGQSL